MTARQITSLALRIFGLSIWLQCLQEAPTWIEIGLSDRPYDRWSLGVFLSLVAVGAVLVLGAPWIARVVPRGDAGEDGPASVQEKQAIAFSVVGLYVILLAGVHATWYLALLGQVNSALDDGPIVGGRPIVLFAALFELAFGAWLFLRGHGLVGLFRRFQGFGVEDEGAGTDGAPAVSRGQVVAFSVLGLFFVVSGVDGLLRWPEQFFTYGSVSNTFRVDMRQWGEIASLVGRIVLGILVFARSTRLAAWWQGLQAPRSKPAEA